MEQGGIFPYGKVAEKRIKFFFEADIIIIPQTGDKETLAEAARTEQDIVFTVFFERFYKGGLVNIEIPSSRSDLKLLIP